MNTTIRKKTLFPLCRGFGWEQLSSKMFSKIKLKPLRVVHAHCKYPEVPMCTPMFIIYIYIILLPLNYVSLAERRHMLCVKFLKGLWSGQVDLSDLLSLLNFKVLVRQNRFFVPFFVPICSSNYMKNEPIRRLMLMANENSSKSYY